MITFDEWYKIKFGISFDDANNNEGCEVRFYIMNLSAHLRDYVSEMVSKYGDGEIV